MTSEPERPRVRRADPTLRSRADHEGIAARLLRRFLSLFFAAALVVPRLRALRRRPAWNWVRVGLLVAAALLAALGVGSVVLQALAAAAVALAAILRRTDHPDRERRVQRQHEADYLLNGGQWRGPAQTGIPPGTPLFLLLRGPRLLAVERDRPSEVRMEWRIDRIRRILVDGSDYVPVYVSEAKQPPVREREVDRHASSELEIEDGAGDRFRFRYRGAFARPLAEAAAYAVHSARSLARQAVPD